jgi:RNA polymerase sigma-70 factor (ECF subfamily)
VLESDVKVESFTAFVDSHERGLRSALTAALGGEVGREAAAEALAYGWEHWDRVSGMDNPAGYLYRVGRNWGGRALQRRSVTLPPAPTAVEQWVEPGLSHAMARLPERQRVVIWLLHSSDWSMSEVANFLQISKSSVQRHAERGMNKLRRSLGVEA